MSKWSVVVSLLLLLSSCFAEEKSATISNLTLRCKQKDGAHVPMSNMTVAIYAPPKGPAARSRAVRGEEWARMVANKDQLGEHYLARYTADEQGVVKGGSAKFDKDLNTSVQFFIECDAGYRKKCPGVDNICEREDPLPDEKPAEKRVAAYIYSIAYGEEKKKNFTSSYLLLKGDKVFHTPHDQDTAKMTEAEFCGYEYRTVLGEPEVVFERPGCECADCLVTPPDVVSMIANRNDETRTEVMETKPVGLTGGDAHDSGAGVSTPFLVALSVILVKKLY